MIRRLARCIREYKWAAILSPVSMIGEVAMEVLIPLVMADLYDYGVVQQNMSVVISKSILLVICALMSMAFGVGSAVFAAKAGTGFAKNLRHDMFYRVQKFSFSNIDKFSSASIVTRLTSDVANLQMTFQMMIRMAVRCPMMLSLALVAALRISPKLSTGSTMWSRKMSTASVWSSLSSVRKRKLRSSPAFPATCPATSPRPRRSCL